MIIRGETNILKIYDLSYLVDKNEYDFSSQKDIEQFAADAASYIDSGEAEAVDTPQSLVGVIPDDAEININEKSYTFEDVTYKNESVDALISDNFSEGDVIALFQAKGDGYFEYGENPDINTLRIGYTACDMEAPDEEIYDFFCDLMLPFDVEAEGEKLEVTASNFYPKDTVKAEIYTVKNEGGKYLQKLCEIDILHENWDIFEDIIQVDYDQNS